MCIIVHVKDARRIFDVITLKQRRYFMDLRHSNARTGSNKYGRNKVSLTGIISYIQIEDDFVPAFVASVVSKLGVMVV
jgi:hypothetical protein